jgi:PPM family protein phosphatase
MSHSSYTSPPYPSVATNSGNNALGYSTEFQHYFRNIRCVARTDRGLRRSENQDSFGIIENESFKLYVVADGMGGARAGGVAAELAISVITRRFNSTQFVLTPDSIVSVIQDANREIHNKSMRDPKLKGMGTTVCGVCITSTSAWVFHVGDSRLYKIQDAKVTQITRDHSLVAELVEKGSLSPAQSEASSISHILTRSLGESDDVDVEIQELPLLTTGELWLICTDGLSGMVPDVLIGSFAEKQIFLEDLVEGLIDMANDRGGVDNITVVAIAREPFNSLMADSLGIDTLMLSPRRINEEFVPEGDRQSYELEKRSEKNVPLEPNRKNISSKFSFLTISALVVATFLIGLFVREISNSSSYFSAHEDIHDIPEESLLEQIPSASRVGSQNEFETDFLSSSAYKNSTNRNKIASERLGQLYELRSFVQYGGLTSKARMKLATLFPAESTSTFTKQDALFLINAEIREIINDLAERR